MKLKLKCQKKLKKNRNSVGSHGFPVAINMVMAVDPHQMLTCCQPATEPMATHFVLVFWICLVSWLYFFRKSVMGCPQKPEPTPEVLVFHYTKTKPPEL